MCLLPLKMWHGGGPVRWACALLDSYKFSPKNFQNFLSLIGKFGASAGLSMQIGIRNTSDDRISFSITRLAASTLAGTSLELERKYRDAASAYQREFASFMKAKTGMLTGGRVMMFRSTAGGEEQKPKPINPHELPEFVFPRPRVSYLLSPGINRSAYPGSVGIRRSHAIAHMSHAPSM